MRITVLGCNGSITGQLRTTCYRVDDDVLIDAGTGAGELSLEQAIAIDSVFLTHSPLDHCCMLPLLADGGRLATITGDPPPSQRGIQLVDAYVAPDGLVLEAAVGQLLARGQTIPIAGIYGLGDAAIALRTVVQGRAEGACVLDPAR